MARVLITNAYSARNRGDAAIILGMIESLRRTDVFGDAEIRVSTADHPADERWYPVPVTPSFHSLKNAVSKNATVNQLFFLLVLLPVSLVWAVLWRLTRIRLPLPGGMGELVRAYAWADLIVAAGGGYLYTNSARRGNVVLLLNLLCFFYGVILGKPVVLYGQSIGPFAGDRQARLVRRALAGVDLIEVREEISFRLVEEWGLETPVHTVADAAFLLEPQRPDEAVARVASEGELRIGMTVRRWFSIPEEQAAYERTIERFVEWLVDRRNATVVFMPQVTFSEGRDDDRVIARKVAAAVDRGDRVRVVEDELTAAEIKWLCAGMDIFVGTRMHSNIFALSSGVPTVAIAYQPKTVGIMSELGLGKWVVPIEKLDLDLLHRSFDGLIDRREEIVGLLDAAVDELEMRALAAGGLIAEAYLSRKGEQTGAGARE